MILSQIRLIGLIRQIRLINRRCSLLYHCFPLLERRGLG
jgi:hypothetical protein